MLHATSKSKLSWDFLVYEDDVPVAQIDVAWLRERATLTIGEVVGRVKRDGDGFAVLVGEQVLMRAEESGFSDASFQIIGGETTFHLKAKPEHDGLFSLSQNGSVIGTITTSGIFSRKIEAQLPERLSLMIRVFIFWLVILGWKRASRAT
jgi:hypothetical protein